MPNPASDQQLEGGKTEESNAAITVTNRDFQILEDGRVVVCDVVLQRALRHRKEAATSLLGAAWERVLT